MRDLPGVDPAFELSLPILYQLTYTMSSKIIRIATRQSPLALWQANYIRDILKKQHPDEQFELLPMVTTGDTFLKDRLMTVGGKGLFVKELEEALLDKRADLAVHSTKDMPAEFPQGLGITAICKRHTPFDALVSYAFPDLASLPQGAVVGTASLRRQSQLLAYRPDLQIKTLRGNVNTRLEKLKQGEYQAIILAAAGLERLGLEKVITQYLSDDLMLPACGQGALCIESRLDDKATLSICASLNDPISALCVQTERLVSAEFGGNCHMPLAVFCTVEPGEQLFLRAKIGRGDGSTILQASEKGPFDQAESLAKACVQALLAQGATELLG